MKKNGVLIVALVIGLMLISLVYAQQAAPSLPDELAQDPTETINKYKNISGTKWTFLSGEWETLFQDHPVLSKFYNVMGPALRYFTGYEIFDLPGFFIAFILSIIVFLMFYYGIVLYFKDPITALLISLILVVIANISGFTQMVVPKILEIFDNQMKIYLIIAVGVLIIILIQYLFSYIKKKIREKLIKEMPETASELRGATAALRNVLRGWALAADAAGKH